METPSLPPSLPQLPDSVRFAAALGQFSKSMKQFTHLHEETSTRLSKVIRLGMIALATLFIAVFIMIVVMAQRINLMVDNIASINKHFHNMVPDISRMHVNMISMQESIQTIEGIPNEMKLMLGSIDEFHQHMGNIHLQMQDMNQQTAQIAAQTDTMTQHLFAMEVPINQMQQDIQLASRPIKMFNKMMPGR